METVKEMPVRIAVFGWFGSKERHLGPICGFYEKRGAHVVPFIADSKKSLLHADGYSRVVSGTVESIAEADAKDPRPFLIHAFSNHGFSVTLEFLEAIQAKHPALFGRIAGLIFDSAPGIPETPSLGFTTTYLPRVVIPGILLAMRKPAAHEHVILTPVLAAASAVLHVTMGARIRRFQQTVPRMSAILRKLKQKRLLLLWGGKDALVPHEIVEIFADRSEKDGFHVEKRFFPESTHVRHLIGHREAYLEAVTTFVRECVPPH